jgi:hypothetical protein
MSRRSLGRGRLIIVLGAVVVLGGCLPAWWTVGGQVTEMLSGNAFDPGSVGIVVFLAAVALLFVIVLPYATRDGETGIDRPLSYGLIWLAAVGAFAYRAYQISQFGGFALPDRAPGLWVTAAGLAVVAWGIVDLLSERRPEAY